MNKRLKPRGIETEADFIDSVNSIARLQGEAAVIIATRDKKIQSLKQFYGDLLKPLADIIDGKLSKAAVYAEEHRAELLAGHGEKKSVETACATYGWRTGNPTVKLMYKVEEDDAITKMMGVGLHPYVRSELTIAKDKILSDCKDGKTLHAHIVNVTGPDTERDVPLSEVGLKIQQSEGFYIDPKIESAAAVKAEA